MKEENIFIQDILNGKKDRFSGFVEQYQDDLYAIAYSLIGDEGNAKRIVLSTFQHVYEKLIDFNVGADFSPWFYQTAIPHLLNRISIGIRQREHEFYELSYPVQKVLVLNYVLKVDSNMIGKLLNYSSEEIEKYLQEGKAALRGNIQIVEQGIDCISKQDLFDYYQKDVSDEKLEEISDHLEFCPRCREIVDSFSKEEKHLVDFFQSSYLPESFSEEVIDSLSPYSKKDKKTRTWKYQILTSSVLLAVVLLGLLVVPKLTPVYNMVSNYLKYGEVYNVWDEGTYVVTDNGVTLEVTSVDINPLHITLHYKVETDTTFPIHNGGEQPIGVWQENLIRIFGNDRYYFPEIIMPIGYSGEPSEEGSVSFTLNNIEEVPDEFDIIFSVRQISYKHGDWRLEIPVNYAKAKLEMDTINIEERIEITNDMILNVKTLDKAETASRLTILSEMSAEQREAKRKRFEEASPNSHYYYADSYYIMPYIEFDIVTENGDVLAMYHLFSEPEVTEEGFIHNYNFMNYLRDKETYEMNRKLESDEKLYMDIRSISTIEPINIDLPMKLEEGEYEVDYKFDNLHIKKIRLFEEKMNYSDGSRWKIQVFGDEDDEIRYDIFWTAVVQEDNYEQHHGLGYSSMYGLQKDDPTLIQEMEIWFQPNIPETFNLRAYEARKYYSPKETKNILIYDPKGDN